MPIVGSRPATTTLKLPIYGESIKTCQNCNFLSQLARIDNVKAKLDIFFRVTLAFHRIAMDWQAQIDANRHHPVSGPEVAVAYRIP